LRREKQGWMAREGELTRMVRDLEGQLKPYILRVANEEEEDRKFEEQFLKLDMEREALEQQEKEFEASRAQFFSNSELVDRQVADLKDMQEASNNFAKLIKYVFFPALFCSYFLSQRNCGQPQIWGYGARNFFFRSDKLYSRKFCLGGPVCYFFLTLLPPPSLSFLLSYSSSSLTFFT
jgi:hypothetical protein